MSFTIYPWQTKQWLHITKMHQKQNLPHAFLFTGLKGIGKQHFAERLVTYFLCDNPIKVSSEEVLGQACGECKQCKLNAAKTHSDFKLTSPEDGSAIIKVDAVRTLVEFFTLSSLQGGLKVTILTPAEALNHNAANALLKTLEEPAGRSLIILISHNPGKLLPTIRSRCQVIDFSAPSTDVAKQWLSDELASEPGEKKILSDGELDALLKLSANAPLKAKEYAHIDALNENNRMLDELGSLLKNDSLASTIANRWDDDLFSLRLAWTIQWLEMILKLKMAAETQTVQGLHGEKMLDYLAGRCTEMQLLALYRESLNQYRLFLGNSNPNKQLGFEYLLHQWAKLMQ